MINRVVTMQRVLGQRFYSENKRVFLRKLKKFQSIGTNDLLPSECFDNRVVLVANTASKCGFTPQLGSMQKLYEQRRERGLTVLAVPSNDFGQQEPGEEDEVEKFYKNEYKVEFPITKKSKVIGPDAHPFFQALEEHYTSEVAPTWNFDKFIIDHTGDLRAVYPNDVDPLDPDVVELIDGLLDTLPQNKPQK
ncbi:glutathione peroxidase [Thraustotheca clavata]|uniref:Glutathione peroxidase n=1 Tax=Thraustotheca clavata TaxID=74557 RepID=A0A1W0ABK1_9STRA|nr:glutathione peroxidase [Thraustotheca clavata]